MQRKITEWKEGDEQGGQVRRKVGKEEKGKGRK